MDNRVNIKQAVHQAINVFIARSKCADNLFRHKPVSAHRCSHFGDVPYLVSNPEHTGCHLDVWMDLDTCRNMRSNEHIWRQTRAHLWYALHQLHEHLYLFH